MIIKKVISLKEYGNPNATRRLFDNNIMVGLPLEYKYWDYIEAFDRVLLSKIILDNIPSLFVLIFQNYFLSLLGLLDDWETLVQKYIIFLLSYRNSLCHSKNALIES